MKTFHYRSQELYVEDVPLSGIIAQVGTPAYVYSHAAISAHYLAYAQALRGLKSIICYSMKCNSNLAVLSSFVQLGSGVDIVSGGELFRALKAGADPRKIVFSGVGKTLSEVSLALKHNILMFNVESAQELDLLNQAAKKLKRRAPIALRINPDIDPKTHPYITTGMKKSKFGIQFEDALELYRYARELPHIEIVGIDCHIGSQLTELDPFVAALRRVLTLVDEIQALGIALQYLDLGGGLGIRYHEETPPSPAAYVQALKRELKGYDLTLLFEPGRSLMGNAGILLSQVIYNKDRDNKHFLIIDAAMNDLIRPAFYGSYHEILPLKKSKRKLKKYDVVGPVCETGDFLAKDRELPEMKPGEGLALMSAGAYGFTMASNYNTRPKAAEILVRGSEWHIVREREKLSDLIRGEHIPDFLKKN